MDAQLKKGLLNICILQFLKQSDLYGYEIVKRIQMKVRSMLCYADYIKKV